MLSRELALPASGRQELAGAGGAGLPAGAWSWPQPSPAGGRGRVCADLGASSARRAAPSAPGRPLASPPAPAPERGLPPCALDTQPVTSWCPLPAVPRSPDGEAEPSRGPLPPCALDARRPWHLLLLPSLLSAPGPLHLQAPGPGPAAPRRTETCPALTSLGLCPARRPEQTTLPVPPPPAGVLCTGLSAIRAVRPERRRGCSGGAAAVAQAAAGARGTLHTEQVNEGSLLLVLPVLPRGDSLAGEPAGRSDCPRTKCLTFNISLRKSSLVWEERGAQGILPSDTGPLCSGCSGAQMCPVGPGPGAPPRLSAWREGLPGEDGGRAGEREAQSRRRRGQRGGCWGGLGVAVLGTPPGPGGHSCRESCPRTVTVHCLACARVGLAARPHARWSRTSLQLDGLPADG